MHFKTEAAGHPIVQFFRKKSESWEPSSFVINSRAMRDVVSRALKDYQDTDMDLNAWEFLSPYKPLVHRWEQLKSIQDSADWQTEKSAADGLVLFLTPLLDPYIQSLKQTWESGMLDCSSVWQIFPPGELVVAKFFGVPTVCRVVSYAGGPWSWTITFEYIDWNGRRCGYTTATRRIGFAGLCRVTSLPVYPLNFAENKDDLKEQITKRGREFERLRGFHLKTCNASSVGIEDNRRIPVSKRLIFTSLDSPSPSLLRPLCVVKIGV